MVSAPNVGGGPMCEQREKPRVDGFWVAIGGISAGLAATKSATETLFYAVSIGCMLVLIAQRLGVERVARAAASPRVRMWIVLALALLLVLWRVDPAIADSNWRDWADRSAAIALCLLSALIGRVNSHPRGLASRIVINRRLA